MKAQILVVDDSLTVRMDLRAILHEAGFAVTACETKAAAQNALKGRTFDLVILDVLLPDGNGIDLLREIRADDNLCAMPVILLSTENEVKHRMHGLRSGADEYIGKPYDGTYIVRTIRTLLFGPQSLSMPGPETQAPPTPNPPLLPPAPAVPSLPPPSLTPPSGPPPVSAVRSLSSPAVFIRRILVVDDSPTYRNACADALREDRHEVIAAASGEEALELLACDSVDLIVLDMLMPGLGGLETCRRIRQIPLAARVPILMVTGQSDEVAASDACRRAGATDYLAKSPELSSVRERVRVLLRKKRSELESILPASSPPTSDIRRTGGDEGSGDALFNQIVAESGLSPLIGATTLARALKRVGLSPQDLSRSNLARALPSIQRTLSTFLAPGEAEKRLQSIAALAKSSA